MDPAAKAVAARTSLQWAERRHERRSGARRRNPTDGGAQTTGGRAGEGGAKAGGREQAADDGGRSRRLPDHDCVQPKRLNSSAAPGFSINVYRSGLGHARMLAAWSHVPQDPCRATWSLAMQRRRRPEDRLLP